ncbi:MAG: peptide chain release factor N(5)-glutamine methyltransferase [Lachnospiraceae bacterium]|nr:peptide chain release factor N(5)-glutamine methyltransferase [Lachnospiraceae bacterium]
MTYKELLHQGEEFLTNEGISDAKTDAWLLLEYCAHISKNDYFLRMNDEISEENKVEFFALAKRRAEHIPLQYITGEQCFMGHNFVVNQNVLIPRADTEILCEEAIRLLKPNSRVLDMCTGSGCILISTMLAGDGIMGVGVDVSKQALIVAKENAKRFEVTPEFIKSDLFDSVTGVFDMIVSNPPYIRSEEINHLMPEVRDFEPVQALDGKEDGLFFYRRIIPDSKDYLTDDGVLILEIGCDQAVEVSDLMENEGFTNVRVVKDLAGLDRVVIGVKGYV